MNKITSPLIFSNQEEKEQVNQQRQDQVAYRPVNQASENSFRYQERLHFDMAKAQLDLERQRASLLQKEESERRIQELRLRYSLCRQLLGNTVYGDSAGNLLLAITTPDEEKIVSKRLLNVRSYQSKIYVAYHPTGERMALEVTWGGSEKNKVYFADVQQGIPPKKFLAKIKSKGVMLLVSKRAEQKAAEALLAYTLGTASVVDLPFTTGWGRNSAGKWHFARKNELTFVEVLRNV